jgi:glycosyltransferase involved in cell wall biosynthesis
MNDRCSIAVYYPHFAGGGAEAVCLWMLEALAPKYDLTLFTLKPVDFQRLDQDYGTALSQHKITVKAIVPKLVGPALNFVIANNKDARSIVLHTVLAELKKNYQAYDLLISAYNAVDLGKPGLQYIHNPGVVENPKYNWISRFSEDALKQNHSFVNSQVVAQNVKKKYGLEAEILYPPVVIKPQEIPWEEKQNSFICSGRLVTQKAPHRAINILKQVRERGFKDIELHITGGAKSIYANQYRRFLNQQVEANSKWVYLHEGLDYEAYTNILYQCRYGIHIKPEPFGISIAEMVKAGAIPFVRKKGGQVEIINYIESLMFKNDGEAVDKIIEVISNSTLQSDLLDELKAQKELFSTQRFCSEIQQKVEDFLHQSS